MGYGEGVFKQAGAKERVDGRGFNGGEFGSIGIYVRREMVGYGGSLVFHV